MIDATNVSPKLRPALLHAVENSDRRLLNQIELRLINQIGLVPADAKNSQHWTAVGIAEVGRDLVVLWEETHSIACNECDGDGYIVATGKTRTIDVECPECDGAGDVAREIGFNTLYTDIDGHSLALANPEDIDFTVPNGCTDGLSLFLKALDDTLKVQA